MTITLTDTNFENEVLKCQKPVLVVFETNWSGSCHIIDPIIEKLAIQHQKRLKVGRVNFDEYKEVAKLYGVWKIPTILFFKNSQVVDRVTGIVSTKVLEDKLNRLFNEE